ncbi:hypothetical protein [Caulobacter sp. BE254]|uniref:hypothetical protein n=1 Tax=Caulobacter sp. BE254 TaxID=2817720 RepID=UPI00285B05EC|nr:hypothetical protein [Caulobacter sp. BE254]MDR7115603.1 hypothetical protein [Caulobacter sp. BE254]
MAFAGLRRDLAAAGWRLDAVTQAPFSNEPAFARFIHRDGRRMRYIRDLLTGETSLEGDVAGGSSEAAAFASSAVETRRQVLRRWIEDRPSLNPRIEAVLRRALGDPDPETRVTALLAALRLRAFSLAEDVRAADIPDSTTRGAFPGDRRLYVRLQALIVQALSGRETHRAERLFATAHDTPLEHPEALLLDALCRPLPDVQPPRDLPSGLVFDGSSVRLANLEIELCWVPDLPHWRGGLRPADRDDVRLRRETPPSGLFVAREPLSPGMLERLSAPGWDGDGRVDAETAAAVARRASAESGARLAIVDAAAWSSALHGPDGRLLPWGNTIAPSQPEGPWGVAWAAGPEWIRVGDRLEAREVSSPRGAPDARAMVRLGVLPE